MSNKITTRDMIGALIDLENDLEYLELQFDPDNPSSSAVGDEIKITENKIAKLKSDIAQKTSNIDHFIMEMNKQGGLIDAEIKRLEQEYNSNFFPKHYQDKLKEKEENI